MFYSQQKRSCAGKRAYVTIGECERAIRALKSQWRGNRHRVVHPYRCNACSAWHLSSMERGEHEERKIQHKRFYAALDPA
jgi:hypothetical protein